MKEAGEGTKRMEDIGKREERTHPPVVKLKKKKEKLMK